jgi:predicted dehydrogenase
MNIAICGVGRIGKFHLQSLLSLRGCRLSGIFDVNQEELDKLWRDFSVRKYRSWAELAEDSATDAVVIATPSASHRQYCCSALAAGKHVFLEKPMAGTLEDATAIVQAARRSSRIVQVGFCERFNVAYIEAKRAIKEGRIGPVRMIRSSRVAPYAYGSPDWELGVLDTAVHNFDLILWLVEELPATVIAKGVNVYDDSSMTHACTTILSFANGAMAVDSIAWVRQEKHPLSYCAQSQMFIQGGRGSLGIDHSSRPAWVMDEHSFQNIDTVILGGPEYYACLKLQLDYFLAAIEGHAPPAVTVDEALNAELVALAAFRSLKIGAEVPIGSWSSSE